MNARFGGLILQCPLLSIQKAAQNMIGTVVSNFLISRASYNNELALEDIRGPLLIIHGDCDRKLIFLGKKDQLFDWHGSQKMIQGYKGGDKVGIYPDNADHNMFDLRLDIFKPIQKFLLQSVREIKLFSGATLCS